MHKIKFSTKNLMGTRLYLSQSGAREHQRFAIFEIMQWNKKLGSFRAECSKSTDYIEKCFDQKLFKIKFPTKNTVDAYLYLPWE